MMNFKRVIQIFMLAVIIFVPLNLQGESENGGHPYYGSTHPYYGKPAGDPIRGATEWANNCSRCHNMRNPSEHTDDIWRVIVTHMRVRAGLTGQQTRDVLAYLMNANFASVVPSTEMEELEKVSGLSGEQIYSGTCISCHGADGNGALPGVPGFSERLTKSDATLIKHIKEGFQSPGSTLMMPPRGGNPDLTDGDIKTVVKYLREKFGS